MNLFQEVFEKELRRYAIVGLIEKKLRANNITLNDAERGELRKHVEEGKDFSFKLSRSSVDDTRLEITLTSDDYGEAVSLIERTAGRLPAIILDAVNEIAPLLLQDLKERWPAESSECAREQSGFRQRLHERWGKGIDTLRMLLGMALEYGDSINQELRQTDSSSQRYLVEVLTRSHARACQILGEIISLLSDGYADGAMARWRTMHELAVISMFISSGGEGLAERYVLHQHVEVWKAAKEYQSYCFRLGEAPFSAGEMNEMKCDYDNVIQRFGPSFRGQYGWAAAFVRDEATFKSIEEATGMDHLRSYYRLASHNVHANPRGVFFKLGLLSESPMLLAGPSNSGLTDPGHGAAIALVQVSAALSSVAPNIDALVGMKMLIALSDEIGKQFLAAHEQLEPDELIVRELEN